MIGHTKWFIVLTSTGHNDNKRSHQLMGSFIINCGVNSKIDVVK